MRLITCKKCQNLREYFCKDLCQLCYGREYQATHREELRVYQNAYYHKNREKISARRKARREKAKREKERGSGS